MLVFCESLLGLGRQSALACHGKGRPTLSSSTLAASGRASLTRKIVVDLTMLPVRLASERCSVQRPRRGDATRACRSPIGDSTPATTSKSTLQSILVHRLIQDGTARVHTAHQHGGSSVTHGSDPLRHLCLQAVQAGRVPPGTPIERCLSWSRISIPAHRATGTAT